MPIDRPAPSPAPSTALPLVLVVEDEPLLRMMAIDLVEDAGFAAISASSAAQAIGLLETRDDIRLMFTDIDLPGGDDGLMMAIAVRDRWPPIGIILTSGHLRPAQADLPRHGVFFAKPYPHDRVMATMRAMIG